MIGSAVVIRLTFQSFPAAWATRKPGIIQFFLAKWVVFLDLPFSSGG
ncbi:MAG: hypothetical protein Q6373_021110 [Candidatus Sigynarchaeota archaeon]